MKIIAILTTIFLTIPTLAEPLNCADYNGTWKTAERNLGGILQKTILWNFTECELLEWQQNDANDIPFVFSFDLFRYSTFIAPNESKFAATMTLNGGKIYVNGIRTTPSNDVLTTSFFIEITPVGLDRLRMHGKMVQMHRLGKANFDEFSALYARVK